MSSRRNVLRLLGGGVVLAATGGGAWYAANGPSAEARAAWRSAGEPEGFRERALSYALLAPNPHNRQPWLVRLEGEDVLSLYCDLDRRLPETDPFDRQITIGCGAFLELLAIAASLQGYAADITPFPEGEPQPRLDHRPVARVVFRPAATAVDPLSAWILERRTNRNTYDDRPVEAKMLARLVAAGSIHGVMVRASADETLAAALRDLTYRAHVLECETHRTMKESVDLMRIGRAEVARHRDGISLEGQAMEAMRLVGLISHEALLDPGSDGFRVGLKMYRDKAMSARAFAWLVNTHDGRASEIAAGRAYMRMTLKAAQAGLAVHPWSQALQEFPEMAALHEEVHGLIGEGRRVQMLVRLGYASPVPPAPRRGLAAHLSKPG